MILACLITALVSPYPQESSVSEEIIRALRDPSSGKRMLGIVDEYGHKITASASLCAELLDSVSVLKDEAQPPFSTGASRRAL